jgi:hypothetical protein
VSAGNQPVQTMLHGAGVVQRTLRTPDIEVRAEVVEHLLLLGQLQRVTGLPEGDGPLPCGQVNQPGFGGDNLRGQLADVGAVVAVLRDRRAQRGRLDRRTEAVHLNAAVVDVELPGHLRSGGGEHPGQRVADGSPPGVSQVKRSGRVRRDELQVHSLPGERVAVTEVLPLGEDRAGDLPGGGVGQRDVQEPRAGHRSSSDARCGEQPGGEQVGDGTRCHAGRLGQLHRGVGCVVAMLTVAGPLHDDSRDLGGVERQRAGGGQVDQGRADQPGQRFRSHER